MPGSVAMQVPARSGCFGRNVMGWSVVGQLSLKKLVLQRPPRAVSRQGSGRRVRDPHTQYTAAQLAFLKENADRPPGSLHGGQLSQLSETQLGEEFMLEPEQIVGWASSQQQKKKAAADRALARKGMPDYDGWETQALEAELGQRGIEWGKKKDPGKRRLLEEDDDRRKLAGGGGKGKGKKKKKGKKKSSRTGGAGQAKRARKPKQKKKPGGRRGKRKAPGRQGSRKKPRRGA